MTKRTLALLLIAISFTGSAASEIGAVYRRVKDSVVVIEVAQRAVDEASRVGLVSVGGIGSGVLISDDGKILTAAHVVQIADQIAVTFRDGTSIAARVVSSDPAADVAMIQLEEAPPASATVVVLGDSDEVEVGDSIFVVGAPLGLTHTLTVGHISARRKETIMSGNLDSAEAFQADAAINQGNSGGPMFDLDGNVIGIVSYIISQGGAFEGMGFAMTSNTARTILMDRRNLWSGFQGQLLEGELCRILNVPSERGILVERVAADSPGERIGLEGGQVQASIAGVDVTLGGDVILEILGVPVTEEGFRAQVRERMEQLKEGDPMQFRVLRGGRLMELNQTYSTDWMPE